MNIPDLQLHTDITLRIDDVVDDNGQAIQDSQYSPQNTDMPIDTTIAPFLMDEPVCSLFFSSTNSPSLIPI